VPVPASHHGCSNPSGTSSPRQVLRFGCSYEAIADCTCSATTIRDRRDEWTEAGVFARLKQIALEAYDRMAGLALEEILIDGCITKAPGGGECAGRSPVDRGKHGMKRSLMTDGYGIPLDRVLAPASRHDSQLTRDELASRQQAAATLGASTGPPYPDKTHAGSPLPVSARIRVRITGL
jgi:transposase